MFMLFFIVIILKNIVWFLIKMIQNYEKLADRISKASGKQREEIDRLVEAKRAKLSGLISREGAAQIVASELGINFEKERMKVNELVSGMKKINILGKIIKLFPVHEFEKNGRKGKVTNLFLADDTGIIKTVLWDTNHIELFERQQIKEGDFIEISNGSLRNSELHLSGFSDIKKSSEVIEDIKTRNEAVEKKISEFNIGGNFKVRAVIVQVFEPRFFYVCSECGKKAVNDGEGYVCQEHGKVVPNKRALMNLVLDDGSENIRAVIFSEQIENLGLKQEDLEENFPDKKQEILGKEMIFSGRATQNKLFNNPEFIINSVESIDVEKLIEVLEK